MSDPPADDSPAGDPPPGNLPTGDPTELARAYYRAIDAGDYDALGSLLAPDFRHERPDRTLAGREAFVRFMCEERPETDTTHELEAVYAARATGAGGVPDRETDDDRSRVAVEGRLRRADGSVRFRFVDVFAVGEAGLAALRTYAH